MINFNFVVGFLAITSDAIYYSAAHIKNEKESENYIIENINQILICNFNKPAVFRKSKFRIYSKENKDHLSLSF